LLAKATEYELRIDLAE